jgi:hypothetical protein
VVATADGLVIVGVQKFRDAERRDRERGNSTAVRGGERRERGAFEAELDMRPRKARCIAAGPEVPRRMQSCRSLCYEERKQREDRDRQFQASDQDSSL